MDILWRVIIGGVVLVLIGYFYHIYGGSLKMWFVDTEEMQTVYVDDVAFSVTVADTDMERKQGLSGVLSLGDHEGKLFVFDTPAKYGIWMKEMNFPIDVLWFDNDRQLIYIEENMVPESYPTVYAPTSDARYVLEIPAHSVRLFGINLGEPLLLPSVLVPAE